MAKTHQDITDLEARAAPPDTGVMRPADEVAEQEDFGDFEIPTPLTTEARGDGGEPPEEPPTEFDYSNREPSPRAKKIGIWATLGAGVATVAALIGFNIGRGDTSSTETKNEDPTEQVGKTKPGDVADGPGLTPGTREAMVDGRVSAAEKYLGTKLEPRLITGSTADEIMAGFRHNLICAGNTANVTTQTRCLEHIFGASNMDGQIGQNYTIWAQGVNSKRINDPGFFVEVEYDIKDAKVDLENNSAVIVANIHNRSSTESEVGRYTFVRGEAAIQQYTVNDRTIYAWVLYAQEPLKEGKTSV